LGRDSFLFGYLGSSANVEHDSAGRLDLATSDEHHHAKRLQLFSQILLHSTLFDASQPQMSRSAMSFSISRLQP
jgi:hypothetical protein